MPFFGVFCKNNVNVLSNKTNDSPQVDMVGVFQSRLLLSVCPCSRPLFTYCIEGIVATAICFPTFGLNNLQGNVQLWEESISVQKYYLIKEKECEKVCLMEKSSVGMEQVLFAFWRPGVDMCLILVHFYVSPLVQCDAYESRWHTSVVPFALHQGIRILFTDWCIYNLWFINA